ncbi:hypothetical protein LZL87_003840 [Fusarium oxysporum]|nr:hypothetical protein LZL87_003840 [Fusarium oxysporum]
MASNAKDSSEGFLTERRVARPPHWVPKGFQGEVPEFFGDAPGDDEARQTKDCLLEFGIKLGAPIPQIIHSEQEEVLGEAWTELVSEYSQMHLTVPSDRLAGIQGIASCLSARHEVEYFAGIFRSQCPYHLMWVTEDPENTPGANQDFPTWSWASSKRKIAFGEAPQDDYGSFMEGGSGSVFVCSSLLGPEEAEPEGMPLEDSDYEDEDREPSRFVLASESPIWKGLICNIYVDDVATSPSLKSRVLLLVLWTLPDEEGTEYRGLVVQIVEEDPGRVDEQDCRSSYRRIGMFWIEQPWDYIQKPQNLKEWKTRVVLV